MKIVKNFGQKGGLTHLLTQGCLPLATGQSTPTQDSIASMHPGNPP